jgi:hypothetical protein
MMSYRGVGPPGLGRRRDGRPACYRPGHSASAWRFRCGQGGRFGCGPSPQALWLAEVPELRSRGGRVSEQLEIYGSFNRLGA